MPRTDVPDETLNRMFKELYGWVETLGRAIHGQSLDAMGAVPASRTVNGKALSADVTLTTADVADSVDRRYVTDGQRNGLHAALTVEDTASVNLTLTGQQLQAAVRTGGVTLSMLQQITSRTALARNTAGAGAVEMMALSGLDGEIITGTPATAGSLPMWNADGDLVDALITASAVPKCVNRQDNAANIAVINQMIKIGWGYMTGTAANYIQELVAFDAPFDVAPIVVLSTIGRRPTADGTPTSPTWFTQNNGEIAGVMAPSASNFYAIIRSQDGSTNLSSSYHYGYQWIAIGTKAR